MNKFLEQLDEFKVGEVLEKTQSFKTAVETRFSDLGDRLRRVDWRQEAKALQTTPKEQLRKYQQILKSEWRKAADGEVPSKAVTPTSETTKAPKKAKTEVTKKTTTQTPKRTRRTTGTKKASATSKRSTTTTKKSPRTRRTSSKTAQPAN